MDDENRGCNSTSAKVLAVQGALFPVELPGMEVEAVNPLIRSRSSHKKESHGCWERPSSKSTDGSLISGRTPGLPGQFRFRGPPDVSEVAASTLCVLGLRIVVLAVTSAHAP